MRIELGSPPIMLIPKLQGLGKPGSRLAINPPYAPGGNKLFLYQSTRLPEFDREIAGKGQAFVCHVDPASSPVEQKAGIDFSEGRVTGASRPGPLINPNGIRSVVLSLPPCYAIGRQRGWRQPKRLHSVQCDLRGLGRGRYIRSAE